MQIIENTRERYLIQRAIVWSTRGVLGPHDLLIRDGILEKISEAPIKPDADTWVIDATNEILLPAGVDPQVHTRVPGQREKETTESVLNAAIAGGVAAFLSMPNTKPVLDDPSSLALAQRELTEPAGARGLRALLSVAITERQKGQHAVPYDLLKELGADAYTDDGVGVVKDDLMREVFRASERTGLPVLQHAEVPGHGAVLAEGPIQKALGLKAYPRAAEIDMIARDLRLLREYPKARYHVLHISCRESVDLVVAARAEGLRVTCEVTPHHLLLSSDDIREGETSFKMNPPLRFSEDRRVLQKDLAEGRIDFMATDHAPHESAIKGHNFKTSAFGTTGLETSLRALLELHRRGILTPSRVVEVFSKKPAEFLGIDDEFGEIRVGRPFYAVLVRNHLLTSPVTYDDLAGQSKNCCFIGVPLPGKVAKTFLRHHLYTMQRTL